MMSNGKGLLLIHHVVLCRKESLWIKQRAMPMILKKTTTTRLFAIFSFVILALVNTPLCAQKKNHQASNFFSTFKVAVIVAIAFYHGHTVYSRQADPSTMPAAEESTIKTTIIDSVSGSPIENITGAIESFKAQNGPAECYLIPHTLHRNSETLKLTCVLLDPWKNT